MKRNKKRNYGCTVAAMLLMIAMLVTGCGKDATTSDTDSAKVNKPQTEDSAETTTVLIDTTDTGATEESPTDGEDEATDGDTGDEFDPVMEGGFPDYGNFPGIYEKEPGITCNIWTQSTGIMVGPTFGTEASPYGEAEYRDGKLFFDIIDYGTEFTYQGEIERTADGIRLTITGSDDPEVPVGSVFEMPDIYSDHS